VEDRAILLRDDEPAAPLTGARATPVKRTAISAVSVSCSSVVVVASLWCVIVLLRQSTNAMIASSLQEILDFHIGIISDYVRWGVDLKHRA
jgi:hypothetical protein